MTRHVQSHCPHQNKTSGATHHVHTYTHTYRETDLDIERQKQMTTRQRHAQGPEFAGSEGGQYYRAAHACSVPSCWGPRRSAAPSLPRPSCSSGVSIGTFVPVKQVKRVPRRSPHTRSPAPLCQPQTTPPTASQGPVASSL